MANKYNLIKRYKPSLNNYKIDKSPAWCLTVFSFKTPITFSREQGRSIENTAGSAVEIKGKIIITSDCTNLIVDKPKDNYLKTLSAVLKKTDVNYLTDILPDDWIMAHIVSDESKLENLIGRIIRGEAVNKFDDGFKFLGRVTNVIEDVSIQNNCKVSTIAMSAIGFKELATSLFYDFNLSEHDIESNNIGTWLAKLGLSIQDLFGVLNKGKRQEDNVHLVIPTLIDLIVGRGADVNKFSPYAIDNPSLQPIQGAINRSTSEAPFAYLVPKEVGALLGKSSDTPSKAGGALSYADLLELLYGIQKYGGNRLDTLDVFKPDLESDKKSNRRYTGYPMMGATVDFMPSFVNKPLWSVLQNYLNPVLNEMFTCLRVNPDGDVVPTVVLRQIPFSTDLMDSRINQENKKRSDDIAQEEAVFGAIQAQNYQKSLPNNPYQNLKVTRFLELPRWVVHPTMVKRYSIRRSSATKCNFVHVYGYDTALKKQNTISEQIALNPPIRDDLDIQRSGLHSYMQTVNVGISNTIGKTPSSWMQIISDFLMNSHLAFTATMTSTGIYEPICEGDNLELEGLVFHIERVTDRCGINSNGMKFFTTDLTLSNGVQNRDSQNNITDVFAGVGNNSNDTIKDQKTLETGVTSVSKFKKQ